MRPMRRFASRPGTNARRQRSFLPSMDRIFLPTIWDWLFLFGPLFCFAWLFLLFCRLAPVAPMYELRELRAAATSS
jgi:hypothetical protein